MVVDTGKTVDVNPFSLDYKLMTAKVADAVVKYECRFTGQTELLLICNAIHVPAMSNNLILPFIMRNDGVVVNDVPKIQVMIPLEADHSVYFPADDFCIPLSLWGIFLYFPTSKPAVAESDGIDDVYALTPDQWDPHFNVYTGNEESMLDWEGNMVEPRHCSWIILADVPDDLIRRFAEFD